MLPILAIDFMLGKPDAHFLSDQIRMELLATALIDKGGVSTPKPPFFDADGGFLDMCDWDGVLCKDGEVKKINWQQEEWLTGVETFFFEHLPRSLRALELSYNDFNSSVPLTAIPDQVSELYLNDCSFTGTTNLEKLPRDIRHLWFSTNNFEGSLALEALPPGVVSFYAQYNSYSGSINLEVLPASMTILMLSNNKLSGSLCFSKLPADMFQFDINRNNFDDFCMDDVPEHLRGYF